jgi:multidrug efflux pump subunit AcrB
VTARATRSRSNSAKGSTALALKPGTSLKVVEPPPGPPVLATLLAEIYGPDPETRRKTAEKVREAFAQVPFVVDIDDSFGQQMPRVRIAIDQDNLEYQKVEEGDVYDTLQGLYAQKTVGYSHRGGGRQPIPITLGLPKSERLIDERALSTPVPANALPGDSGVVELGDVVSVRHELSSFPIFRHNGKPAEMVTAELAGAFEAPVYGMIEVGRRARPGGLDGAREAHDRAPWPAHRRFEAGAAVGRRVGGDLGHVPRHGRSLPGGAARHLHPRRGAVRFLQGAAGDPDAHSADADRHHVRALAVRRAFTATSMIGFIALAGIIVRNSILLVDFVKHTNMPGADLREVVLKAGAIRFKPILLTAIAAMIGAAVILADPIFQGLAISLLFGLASSTLLTVLVIPAIYMVLRYRAPDQTKEVPAA